MCNKSFFMLILVAMLSLLTLSIGLTSPTDAATPFTADESFNIDNLQRCPDG